MGAPPALPRAPLSLVFAARSEGPWIRRLTSRKRGSEGGATPGRVGVAAMASPSGSRSVRGARGFVLTSALSGPCHTARRHAYSAPDIGLPAAREPLSNVRTAPTRPIVKRTGRTTRAIRERRRYIRAQAV